MKLFFRKLGEGPPLIILHGLFGLNDNWLSLARLFSKNFTVYVVDNRNHGQSPHSELWNYDVMAEDLLELMEDERIGKAALIGHSMGGKIIMRFAEKYPERIVKMLVVDIAPRYYEPHHHQVMEALHAIDFNLVHSRKQVEEVLLPKISDYATRQFILKNIYWKEDSRLDFRFNLPVISKNIEQVGEACFEYGVCLVPTLFIRGGKSNYISNYDIDDIHQKFITAEVITIEQAGHWVHAEAPEAFYEESIKFLSSTN